MEKYIIEITEVLQKQINIVAESKEQAISKVKELYKNQAIVLDDTNHIETKFGAI